MMSALHPQTQMTFKFADEILPRAYGFPMKIRVPIIPGIFPILNYKQILRITERAA